MTRSAHQSSGKGKAVAKAKRQGEGAKPKGKGGKGLKQKKEETAVERFWLVDDRSLGILKAVIGIRRYNHDGLEEDDDGDSVVSLGVDTGEDGMSEKENEVPLEGSSKIVKAFLHNHKTIDLDQTLSVLKAYRQFLTVKKEAKDWEGNKLSPCFLVSEMFELHSEMQDTYENDMKLLCGRVINWEDAASYNEDEDAKAFCAELAAREQATIDAIQKRFDTVDEWIWNIISIGIERHEPCDFDWGEEEECIQVLFRERKVQLSTVFEEWAKAQDTGVDTDNYDFLWEREKRHVNSNDTPITLGMNFDDISIKAVSKKAVTIVVRDTITGEEEIIYQTRKKMLSCLMNDYADTVDTGKSDLVFTFNGKRIFGHEHAREFNLSHYDVIDVTPASSFKCENCICCNPTNMQDIFSVV